jgi:hypothetical protein
MHYSPELPDAACNMSCAGMASETCGGNYTISVYIRVPKGAATTGYIVPATGLVAAGVLLGLTSFFSAVL